MTFPLADVLAFRAKIRPELAPLFMDMVAEAERSLSNGHSMADVKAEIAKVTTVEGAPPFVMLLGKATLDFLETVT